MSQAYEGAAILKRVVELQDAGTSFAMATIVWRRGPSSGQKSSRAIIHNDGTIEGWIGGACAEPVVIREGQKVISDGEPRLIWLGQQEELNGMHFPDGVVSIPMSCQSEGALQVYIEPMLSMPSVVVIGRSLMSKTLNEILNSISWRTTLVDMNELESESLNRTDAVIVATQGHGDEDAILAALETDSPFIGAVVSRKRAESIREFLRDRGCTQAQINRVQMPIGEDLGHTSHLEMAVSIAAGLVKNRSHGAFKSRSNSVASHSGPTSPKLLTVLESEEVLDLICGMTVPADNSHYPYEYDGRTFYFCCAGCRTTFSADPVQYLKQEAKC